MTRTYTESVVSCAVCDQELSDSQILAVWQDVDWIDHGDHWIRIPRHQLARFYARANDLSEDRSE